MFQQRLKISKHKNDMCLTVSMFVLHSMHGSASYLHVCLLSHENIVYAMTTNINGAL